MSARFTGPVAVCFAVSLVGLAPGGCGPARRSIGGQVFIVTGGGQSLELGLVDVRLFDAGRIRQHLEDRERAYHERVDEIRALNAFGVAQVARDNRTRDSLNAQYRRRLEAELRSAETDLSRAESSQRAAIGLEREAAQAYQTAIARAIGTTSGADIAKGVRADAEKTKLERAQRNRDVADALVETQRQRIADLRARIAAPVTNLVPRAQAVPELDSDWYFQDLPPSIQSAETDAEGRFELVAPKPGEYVLAARAARDLDGVRESYFWLVRVSVGKERQTVLLGNSTWTRSDSPRSLLHLAR